MIEEKAKTYCPNIQEPLEKQKLKDETIIILGLIYRDFYVMKMKGENYKKKIHRS